MKKLFKLLILAFLSINCIAQDEVGRNKERNIKTTDLYLYGEAIADTPKDATKLAKKILISKIFDFEPALINNSDQIEKIIENSDQFLSMERGVKYRSIAFYLKSDIKNLIRANPLKVSMDPITAKQETSKRKGTERKEDELKTVSIPLIRSDSVAIVHPKKEKTKIESELNLKVGNQNLTQTSPTQKDFLNGKELLQYILKIDDAHKLGRLFDEQKQKGMLIYGGKASISFSDKCYIVFYSHDGAVKAYLDKGNSLRKNLITGEMESMNLYKDLPFIWFQLMN